MTDYITLSQIMGGLMRMLGDACLIAGVWLLVELGKAIYKAYWPNGFGKFTEEE